MQVSIKYTTLFILLLTCYSSFSSAKGRDANDELIFAPKKFYFSNDFDGALLSTALQTQSPAGPGNVGTPRFSYFWNGGFNVNYDFSKVIGLFSGLSVKNIGFIEKSAVKADSTIKRRVYTIGVPLGIKIGNLKKKQYIFIGGGVDFPFNYKEKGYIVRNNKEKFNEWFSDRTPRTMPYGFVGFSVKGFYVKAQYYPSNFMNPDYIATTNSVTLPVVKPYAAYDVQLLVFSIGFDIRYGQKMKITPKSKEDPVM
ncbi:MAG: hypothetical protein H6551_10570 [Chitinophagales bacterium]|nr:hypothetical protein [Chitinophagaceae bacterium]MCB9065572.1 hypothetical protein [Chitinophagales bacterium]